MQRLLVVILAAFDAVIAAAAGIAVALAPLTLLWVFVIGDPVWAALWPATGTVWQFGHLVPVMVTLPAKYLALTGIPADAASFVLSLAPLGFAAFTAIFAARSGVRAARAGAWITGVVTGSVVMTAIAAGIGVTARNAPATVQMWQAVLFPALIYAIACLAGALVAAWREGDAGMIDRMHDRVDALPGQWGAVPGLVARGSAVALVGLIGVGAAGVLTGLVLRGGEVIALFETGNVDALGATVITLGQLAYLPTLIMWAIAFVAGPGFGIGIGTAVSPAGTQLGVVPAVPVLGIVPETTSPWLLALAIVPVIIGGAAGWAVRGRIALPKDDVDAAAAVPAHPALIGLIPERDAAPEPRPHKKAARPTTLVVVVALGIAVVTGAFAALGAFLASGSLGPGRLAEVGPAGGPVALAVGAEVLVGAAIVLLTTRRVARRSRRADPAAADTADRPAFDASASVLDELRARVEENRPSGGRIVPESPRADPSSSPGPANPPVSQGSVDSPEPDAVTAPVVLPDPSTLGRHRPAPLPPVD